MSGDSSYLQTLSSRGATTFSVDPRGTFGYLCRLGFNYSNDVIVHELFRDHLKIFLRKINETIQSDQVRCSLRQTLFDVSVKVVPSPVGDVTTSSSKQKMVGSVHGRFFRHLVQELHLQRPLELRLTIRFEAPLNKTVVTEDMTFITDPRETLWPNAFKFETELEGDPWVIPSAQTSVNYTLSAVFIGCPFIASANGLGIVPENWDGEAALMNKKFQEEQAYCDFTLVSGNGEDRVQCHKLFLASSSPFFERMIQTNMKEGNKNECSLKGSTKEGLDALLKFLYYRDVEDALTSSVLAYELLDLGHMYDIPRLEGTMKDLMLAKLDDWWDLEVTLELFLRTRLLTDDDEWQPLKVKVEQVLKMRSNEWTSDSNTLLTDLMAKDSNAAKELVRLLSQQDNLD